LPQQPTAASGGGFFLAVRDYNDRRTGLASHTQHTMKSIERQGAAFRLIDLTGGVK
jgi:hypothetical protein